jgi:calnexin
MRSALFLLCCLARGSEAYTAPTPSGEVLMLETFQSDWESRWVPSKKEVYTGEFAAEGYKVEAIPGDVGLTMPKKAHRYGLSHKLATPVLASEQPLVVQYEVSLKGGLECGGAYLKLLNVDGSFDGEQFEEPTPYSIMFGPDKCANAGKIHFIFKFKNPVTGELVEHHLKDGPPMPPTAERVVQTHLYRFALLGDNKLSISVDDDEARAYSLLEDFEPPVNPPETIPDPTDTKPEDWVDEKMIEDPSATKPDDWDEDAPYQIPDPQVRCRRTTVEMHGVGG